MTKYDKTLVARSRRRRESLYVGLTAVIQAADTSLHEQQESSLWVSFI